MVFCNFLSVHFYRDEEEKEEERQEKQEKEKKLDSRDRKTFNVRPSCQYSENEQDISKKSTEKPTKTKTKTNRSEKSNLLWKVAYSESYNISVKPRECFEFLCYFNPLFFLRTRFFKKDANTRYWHIDVFPVRFTQWQRKLNRNWF